MNYLRGYFSLKEKEDGLYLEISKKEYGEEISINEISKYIYQNNISIFNEKIVKKFLEDIKRLENEKSYEFKISEERIKKHLKEQVEIFLSTNYMEATAKFYPPTSGGKMLELDEVIRAIRSAGVNVEVKESELSDFLQYKKYEKKYIIANGIKPIEGKDAKIIYHFKLDKTLEPKEKPDGSVDFRTLDIINKVHEGELLAEIEPEIPGIDGCDVLGRKIFAKKVEKKFLKVSGYAILSDEKDKVYAGMNGHVELKNDVIDVSNIYTIEGDIGAATGNIDYVGNVCINGNVPSDYSVRADGNIIINGNVEGAIVEATGSISISRGIGGKKKGIVSAGESIVTKFIENSTVVAGKDIHSEMILHSIVTADDKIQVTAGKGTIVGGQIKAIEEIRCKIAGSIMETLSVFQVGKSFDDEDNLKEMEQKREEYDKQKIDCLKKIEKYVKKLNKGINLSEKERNEYEELTKTAEEISDNMYELNIRYKKQEEFINCEYRGRSKIIIEKKVNAGVKICISGVSRYIRQSLSGVKFEKRENNIVDTSIDRDKK